MGQLYLLGCGCIANLLVLQNMTTNCLLEPDSYYPKVLCGSEVQKGGAKWCLGPHELTSHFGVLVRAGFSWGRISFQAPRVI